VKYVALLLRGRGAARREARSGGRRGRPELKNRGRGMAAMAGAIRVMFAPKCSASGIFVGALAGAMNCPRFGRKRRSSRLLARTAKIEGGSYAARRVRPVRANHRLPVSAPNIGRSSWSRQNKRKVELRRMRRIYDLNKPEDRAYLLNRGFVWAVIYPHGEKRGKVISAHRGEKGVKFSLKYLNDSKVDVVKIAEYPDDLS
jgi:hypothetical protein